MIVIDTNSLLLLIIGTIDINRIQDHERISIYDEEDYLYLLHTINNKQIITLPNILTEVDNLLRKSFSKNNREKYVFYFDKFINANIEKYLPFTLVSKSYTFFDLG